MTREFGAFAVGGLLAFSAPSMPILRNHGGNANHGDGHHGDWHHGHWPRGNGKFLLLAVLDILLLGYPYCYPSYGYPPAYGYGWRIPSSSIPAIRGAARPDRKSA